jgi:hypothetical protein
LARQKWRRFFVRGKMRGMESTTVTTSHTVDIAGIQVWPPHWSYYFGLVLVILLAALAALYISKKSDQSDNR